MQNFYSINHIVRGPKDGIQTMTIIPCKMLTLGEAGGRLFGNSVSCLAASKLYKN